MRTAIVLLSGLDSATALHWALPRFAEVTALGISYGQVSTELDVAQRIAERRGVRWIRDIAIGFGRLDPRAGTDAAGVSRAFVPGRNARLVWRAASLAASLWPGGSASIVVGCNADDADAFPDCRPAFLAGLGENLHAGLEGWIDLRLEAPWLDLRKAAILRWAVDHPPAVLEDAREAVSCYRGTRCGMCDACTLRARAFAEAGIEDGESAAPHVDPSREPRCSP
jgi:7-cyano-7-deazaguanine synthase